MAKSNPKKNMATTPSPAPPDAPGGSPPDPGVGYRLERSFWFGFLCIVGFASFVHTRVYPMVSDVDSFYHLRHAWVYATQGLFDSAFPWARFSLVSKEAADLWYGLHIVTVPLTWLPSLVDAIYLGAFLVTVTSLSLVFVCLRLLDVRWPIYWVFFFALICPDVLYRLTMVRPHPLSLALTLVLFSLLVGRDRRFQQAYIFVLAFLVAWLHLALLWLPVVVLGAVSMVRLLHRRAPRWDHLAAFFPGLLLGVFLRPNPLGGLRLAYVQVVQLMIEKRASEAFSFGIELYPFYWEAFVAMFLPISALMTVGIAYLAYSVWRSPWRSVDLETSVGVWTSLLLALTFFTLSFTMARRSHEVFFGMATLFLALLLHRVRASTSVAGVNLAIPAALLLVAALPWNVSILDSIEASAFPPAKMQPVGRWLEQNAKPGEVVFHTHWDRFAELFFWNPRNHYINGMDPIFEYAASSTLAWKHHYYELDAVTDFTCGVFPCPDELAVPTLDCLKNDFQASYIVVEPDRTPNFSTYLAQAPGFARAYQSPTGVQIYRIL